MAWAVAIIGALMAAVAWSSASPAGSAPDDNFHVGTIWCKSVWHSDRCQFLEPAAGAYGQDFYLVPPQATFSGSPTSSTAPCYIFDGGHDGSCPAVEGYQRLPINAGLYPPLYYSFAGLFAAETQDRTVLQVRIAVSLSVIALFAAAYAATLRWLRPAFIVSVAVGLVPLGVSFIASTNPERLGDRSVMASWPLAVTTLLATGGRRRLAAGALWVVAATMACGSRADAAAYVAAIAFLSVALLWNRATWAPRILAIAVMLGGGLVLLGSGQTSNVTAGFLENIEGRSTGALAWQAFKGIPGLWVGGTGAPGGPTNANAGQLAWFDVPVPPVAWVGLLMVIGALMLIGIGWLPWQKGVYLAALTAFAIALPFYVLLKNKALPGELLQPRYLLPLMVVIFAVSMVRPARAPLHLTRTQVGVVILLVTVAQAASLHVFMRRFITGIDADGLSLARDAQWWWDTSISPNTVWLLGSLGWAAFTCVALFHFLAARPPSEKVGVTQTGDLQADDPQLVANSAGVGGQVNEPGFAQPGNAWGSRARHLNDMGLAKVPGSMGCGVRRPTPVAGICSSGPDLPVATGVGVPPAHHAPPGPHVHKSVELVGEGV